MSDQESQHLAVIVLTKNEAKHIRDCLTSVRSAADELLVLDAGSEDATVELARAEGARVEFRPFDNFANQRNAAALMTNASWIFYIDADERASPALMREIRECTRAADAEVAGFWVPRRNIIFGKEIRHTGWSPDFQPRVLRRARARFDPTREVHELVVWDGETRFLQESLIHYNYETLHQFHVKQRVYTAYEAKIWHEEGKRARLRGFVGQPLREFFRRYFQLAGWRDGGHGLLLSLLMARYAVTRQKMLWDMRKK